MGHERVGLLPKTRRWADLVSQLGSLYSSDVSVSSLASQTIDFVRGRYELLIRDDATRAVFTFLVSLSRAFRSDDSGTEIRSSGIPISDHPTLLQFVEALRDHVPPREASSEYGQLALQAGTDALREWNRLSRTSQLPLFEPSSATLESWRTLGTGAGFCELSRLFFGSLTERYLNYFLERAASASLTDLQHREQFREDVGRVAVEVSQHAFETAKITQSFAAGWFNKHAATGMPDQKDIESFLAVAFGKLRDELRREGEH